MNQYAERDVMELGGCYIRHVIAMTREKLHEKTDIAAELAFRDMQIDALTKQRDELLSALELSVKQMECDALLISDEIGRGLSLDELEEINELPEAIIKSRSSIAKAIAKAKGGAVNHFPDAGKMVPDGCAVLMTLDEAIDHANEKSIGSSQCAAQHAQLAKWLTDYRAMLAAAPKLGGG